MTAKAALDLLRAGDAAGALSLLDCVAADDAKPAPLAARGMALLDVNDPGAARIALRAAVALGDTSPPTLLNLAIAEDRAGDIARARGLMQTVAEVPAAVGRAAAAPGGKPSCRRRLRVSRSSLSPGARSEPAARGSADRARRLADRPG